MKPTGTPSSSSIETTRPDPPAATRSSLYHPPSPEAERRRRKRELILIVVILLTVVVLTFAETRIIRFGADIPVSNTILMFILININLLLLVLLLFLVFRNLVKLLYDRRRRVMGAKLRTRLVVAFIALTLLPTTVLFFFSISFIATSIDFWFNVPVEQALQNSLEVARRVYDRVETDNRFFLERVSFQIHNNKLLAEKNHRALSRYIQVVQREFNLDAVEIYGRDFQRLTFALSPGLENQNLQVLARESLAKDTPLSKVNTFTEFLPTGELVRTVGTVPFGVARSDSVAYVVLGVMLPSQLSSDMESITRGFEEYQQIKLLKRPIQITYVITLSIVALLVVFCAVWFGFYLAKSITVPIMELAEGTRRVADGDLGFSINLAADDEIGSLVDSFNKMTRDLRSGREQLELSTRMLKQQNVEIEQRRQYMEVVLNSVSTGVISVDAEGLVSTINQSAAQMLRLRAEAIRNRNYQDLLPSRYRAAADEVMEQLRTSESGIMEMPIRITIAGRPRSLLISLAALRNENGDYMGAVMVFDDLTELEKAQRMAAWREVARRIAHEVKNPLTPISLSAQRLRRKYADRIEDPVFDECTRMIIDHVDLIRNLVNEFSAFARFPAANPSPCNLPPIVEETMALYREGHPTISFETRLSGDLPLPTLFLDRQQIKQALINLVDNAITAIKGRGRIEIHIVYRNASDRVRLEVADSGPGISDEDKARLFEPNFSTKKSGMGLGLTIVNTIVADHGGTITVSDNQPHGAKFIIELPVRALPESAAAV